MSSSPDPSTGAPDGGRLDDGRPTHGESPSGAIVERTREELARATHDVNNALNSVLVATHMLQLNAADPDAVRRHADRIAQAARQGVAAAARLAAAARTV